MADLTTMPVLSVCATVGSKLADLTIKNGQLIFVHDKHTIALDYNGKRTFYNCIEELATEGARISMLAPVTGRYYFVIETAVLWTYRNGWIQLTTHPEDIVFIGIELPALGTNKTLYVNTADREISVWDSDTSTYTVVAERTKEMTAEDIDALFQKD